MKHWFKSDNTAPACPEVMQALLDCNAGYAAAYGDDDWSRRLDTVFSDWFGTRVRVLHEAWGEAVR